MSGTHTHHPRLTHLATAVSFGVAISFVGALIQPAVAHTLSDPHRERHHIKRRARRELGTRYRYGGTSPRGFDCSGFTMWVFDGHGASLPHRASRQFDLARQRGFKRIWKRAKLEKGDLVFFKTTSARVGHAGIYIGRGKFISATSHGVRVQSVWDRYYWGRRFVAATRVPATNDGGDSWGAQQSGSLDVSLHLHQATPTPTPSPSGSTSPSPDPTPSPEEPAPSPTPTP
jgi:cell wall-associated NlpC family hydrolase